MTDNESPPTTLGELIAAARKRSGLPRTRLAAVAGISPNSMAKYEKAGLPGGKVPSLEKLARICEVLELDPREVFDVAMMKSPMKEGEPKFFFTSHFKYKINEALMEKSINSLSAVLELFSHEIIDLRKELRSISPIAEKQRPYVGDLELYRKELMENGSDRGSQGPSRRNCEQGTPEAVPAAPTTDKKGSRDEGTSQ